MGKILSVLLGLGVLGYIAYHVMYQRSPTGDSAQAQTPPQQLENVRNAAKRIENDDARRAQEALDRAAQAEAK